jgi:hypothetical protein
VKPERDPVRCAWDDCEDEGEVATPVGPLCPRHSAVLAREMEDER